MQTLDDLPPEFHQQPDVQAIYSIVNALLLGTKKLVIESIPQEMHVVDNDPYRVEPSFKHTFRLEDVNDS
jgi:hypothetical protein